MGPEPFQSSVLAVGCSVLYTADAVLSLIALYLRGSIHKDTTSRGDGNGQRKGSRLPPSFPKEHALHLCSQVYQELLQNCRTRGTRIFQEPLPQLIPYPHLDSLGH